MSTPISWFPSGDERELSPDLQAVYARCREKLGFVPNVFLAYQWRPSRLAAWVGQFDAVMAPTETLPAAEREMIAVAVSMAAPSVESGEARAKNQIPLATSLGD